MIPLVREFVPGQQMRLRVVTGERVGEAVPLAAQPVSLGREVGNSMVLSDRKVSRFHAKIEPLDGSWVLSDLGSTNGTRLNGVEVTRAGIQPGDLIYLGDVVLAVEA